MQGEIAITEESIKFNKMGWSVFDFFREDLRRFTKSHRAGWYAYKKVGSIYYFKWIDGEDGEKLNSKYLLALKKDKWILGVSSQTINDYFI